MKNARERIDAKKLTPTIRNTSKQTCPGYGIDCRLSEANDDVDVDVGKWRDCSRLASGSYRK